MLSKSCTTGTVEAGSAEVAAGGGNSMEALEAAVAPGTQLPGFVSAGIVQPGKKDQPAAGLSHPQGRFRASCGFPSIRWISYLLWLF